MNKNKLLNIALTSAIILAAAPALTATTTGLGATSTGTTVINMTIAKVIEISALDDIAIDQTEASGRFGLDNYCVYTNGSAGSYTVVATSANGGGSSFGMQLSTDATVKLPYSVEVGTLAATSPVTYNTSSASIAAHTTSRTCGAANNASVEVHISNAAIDVVESGLYQDTLTLVVSPD